MTGGFAEADRLAASPVHASVIDALAAGIEAADPAVAVRRIVRLDGDRLHIGDRVYDLGDYDELLVLGGGKAAGAIATALETRLGDRLSGGAVVVPDPVETVRIEGHVGGHPLPDAGSVAGTRRILELAEDAGDRTLVIAVVTGGASALLSAPAPGLDLDDLRDVTAALLEAGADIDGINAVRKHASAIKGGGLARTAAPATVVSLLVSDVVGDDPSVIGSGPTAPDPTTFAEALAVLDRHGVEGSPALRRLLEAGAAGERAETPTSDDPVVERVVNRVIVTGWTAIEAAREAVSADGYTPCVLSSRFRGEAREAGLAHADVAAEVVASGNPVDTPAALISGGETTVTVSGSGRGGPNLEFALRAAMDLPAAAVLGAVDTDGADGSTPAAGALVDDGTVDDREAAMRALADNDAYGYLQSAGALLTTGATGTNVNDLRVLVVPA